jgi:hypothetical protein
MPGVHWQQVDITSQLIFKRHMWKQWVNAIAGVAVLATPFLSLSSGALTWTLAIAGLVVAILSVWSAAEGTSYGSQSTYAHR